MGQVISKEKKQKKEGLMTQMKSKTEQTPKPSPTKTNNNAPNKKSPSPPPPRSLSSTLGSESLSEEFLVYLQKLDKDSGGDHDREDSLKFVLKVRFRNLFQTI